MDIEIPLGKRTKLYRFFEMLPAIVSYGAIILLVLLSIINPIIASIYLLVIILTMLVKVVGISYHMISGRNRVDRASAVAQCATQEHGRRNACSFVIASDDSLQLA